MKIDDYIAGDYQQQYQYKSFLPTFINHDWLVNDGDLLTLLSDADRALGELNAYSQLVPDVDFFIRMHITKEATESSKLEGTQTNMEEAFLEVEDVEPDKRDDWEEVQNYIKAINDAIYMLEHLPLSNRLIKSTHKILMQGVRGEKKQPGEFRSSQNWIGVNLKHAVFIPPHADALPDLMGDLEGFIHNNELQVPHLI
jgi:Fic family protein